MMVPNEYYQDFGKILFCLADICVGWLLFKIMGNPNKTNMYVEPFSYYIV